MRKNTYNNIMIALLCVLVMTVLALSWSAFNHSSDEVIETASEEIEKLAATIEQNTKYNKGTVEKPRTIARVE